MAHLMKYKKCPFLRYLVKELKSFQVEIELDYKTGEVLGVKTGKTSQPKNRLKQ
jgi:hypothetical protein